MRRRRALGLLGGAAALTACGDGPPTGPNPPDPTPTPEPTPSPTPQPWRPVAFPVRVSGHNFVDGNGVLWRWGAWNPSRAGWTVPSLSELQEMAAAGVNCVGVRLGPQSPDGPDGMHAPPTLWSALETCLVQAYSLGLVVEVSLIDAWVIQHGYNYFGWGMDIAHRLPTSEQTNWLREAAAHLRGHPNVILLDGNESFKLLKRPFQRTDPSTAWSRAVRDIMRRELPGVPIGTNAERGDIERLYDYVVVHQDAATSVLHNKPTGVNESGPAVTPQSWAAQSQAARRAGTFFDLWRGDMGDDEWQEALLIHADLRRRSGR